MNFATTKERILQYIDFKGITISIFFKETGIKRGFLDTDKLKSSVSDNFIAIIIETYPEINLQWLITGNGEMLNKKEDLQLLNEPAAQIQKLPPGTAIDFKDDLIQLQKEKIAKLQEDLKRCEEEKKMTGNNKTLH